MPLTMDPEFYKALEPLMPALTSSPKPEIHDIASRRRNLEAIFTGLVPLPEEPKDMSTTEHEIKSYDGANITVTRFLPKALQNADKPGPAVLHIHGGGMIAGSVSMFSRVVKATAEQLNIQYFSVEYRLAPENPAPAGLEDCYAALVWLSKNASSFNVDPKRIVVRGESAGGGLALGTSLLARDRALDPPIAKQILIYPMLDDKNVTPNPEIEPIATWTITDNITGWTALLGDKFGTDDVSPYYAPARQENLQNLPPTYIDVGGLDNFIVEDSKLAAKLLAANIQTEFHVYPGVPHAFEAFSPEIAVTKAANENRARATLTV